MLDPRGLWNRKWAGLADPGSIRGDVRHLRLKFPQRHLLDLPDPLPGESQLPADLVERHRLSGIESVAEPQDFRFAFTDRLEEPFDPGGVAAGPREDLLPGVL